MVVPRSTVELKLIEQFPSLSLGEYSTEIILQDDSAMA